MVGGLVGVLAAAVPGLIDLLDYKDGAPPVKKFALAHIAINLTVVALCAVNIWLRAIRPDSITIPVSLSVVGVCMIAVSGRL